MPIINMNTKMKKKMIFKNQNEKYQSFDDWTLQLVDN